MASKVNFDKYLQQEVDVVTLEPSSMSFTAGKGEDGPFYQGESNADNSVSGTVVEVTDQTLTVEYERRSRIYRNEIFFHAISSINTSRLTEAGEAKSKATSERFKGVQKKKQKKE